nr:hypothetical protein [Tanacetum cinerariifolium]
RKLGRGGGAAAPARARRIAALLRRQRRCRKPVLSRQASGRAHRAALAIRAVPTRRSAAPDVPPQPRLVPDSGRVQHGRFSRGQ